MGLLRCPSRMFNLNIKSVLLCGLKTRRMTETFNNQQQILMNWCLLGVERLKNGVIKSLMCAYGGN